MIPTSTHKLKKKRVSDMKIVKLKFIDSLDNGIYKIKEKAGMVIYIHVRF